MLNEPSEPIEPMERAAAAALLGVPIDADAGEVRRAYRLWARMAHPDAGGDPEAFARLTQARRTMLKARPARPRPGRTQPPAPRPPLSAMVRRPQLTVTLTLGLVALITLTALPRLGLPSVVAALAAGVGSAAWTASLARRMLRTGADAGHRIALLALLWLPVAFTMLIASILLGTGFVEVLPALALPFAALISWQNAGAGLWRPIAADPRRPAGP